MASNLERMNEILDFWAKDKTFQRSIDERSENGPFYYAEDLEAVRGIGPKTIKRFREMIDLSLNESEEENGLSSTVP